jgi:hypothetical protein
LILAIESVSANHLFGDPSGKSGLAASTLIGNTTGIVPTAFSQTSA